MADLTGKTLGNYRIVERIGRGGMATVYKAYQPALERYVAVKVIHERLVTEDGEFFNRFRREAKSVAALRHPNVVQVFDFGVEDDAAYMVMEYLEGGDLKDELKASSERGETMPLAEAQRIFQAVAKAVDYAYSQGMAHRDLKPDNVMLTIKGDVVLTDFGIAKIVGGTQYTAAGAVMGTPAYMSPEQGMGERGDERSDIYSLGVILYEMVADQVPFEADTPLAVIFKHISDPLPLPRQMNPAVPEAVEQVILKALAKDPDDRYQRAAGMAAALSEAMAAEAKQPDREAPIPEATVASKTVSAAPPPAAVEALPTAKKGLPGWAWGLIGTLVVIGGIFLATREAGPSSTPETTAAPVAGPSSTAAATPPPTCRAGALGVHRVVRGRDALADLHPRPRERRGHPVDPRPGLWGAGSICLVARRRADRL